MMEKILDTHVFVGGCVSRYIFSVRTWMRLIWAEVFWWGYFVGFVCEHFWGGFIFYFLLFLRSVCIVRDAGSG